MAYETKNNFDKKVQMHLACSKDDFRPENRVHLFQQWICIRNRYSHSRQKPHL